MNVEYEDIEKVLEVYSLTEVFEMNQLEEADVLFFLVQEDFVNLPKVLPL